MKQSRLEQLEKMMARQIPRRRVGIVKLQMVKEGTLYGEMLRFQEPEQALALMCPLFHKADREMLVAISLSTALEPLAVELPQSSVWLG